jgi:hypothetical protein
MEYDKNKVDEMVLALMSLVMHSDGDTVRAWKGFDWDTLLGKSSRLPAADRISRRSITLCLQHSG